MKLFIRGLKEWKIELTKNQMDLFYEYYNWVLFWNKKFNVTSITDKEEFFIKHLMDSLSSVQFVNYKNQNVIDIGTGIGFPGIPLKIIFSELKMTLVDSSEKKAKALNHIINKLNIQNCQVINNNIENIGRDSQYRDSYDFVLVRALSSLNILLEYGIPLLREQSRMIIYKGPGVEKEVENSNNAFKKLECRIDKSIGFTLPFTNFKRVIIIVEKVGKTPLNYPRKVGLPRKRPIC